MSLSQDVLAFLTWLDETGDVFVLDHLKTAYGAIDETSPAERSENQKTLAIMQHAIAQVVESRMAPVTDSRDRLESFLEAIGEFTDSDPLDAHFTLLALSHVPGSVNRWRKLRKLRLHSAPSVRVSAYFRQATTSYLCGLFDAVAILSRSVIQFSLEERIPANTPELQMIKQVRKDLLYRLIELGYKKGLINLALRQAAHDVRERGNDASHESACTEEQALAVIKDTRRVLVALYTGIKSA